jgi:hypothetical protein
VPRVNPASPNDTPKACAVSMTKIALHYPLTRRLFLITLSLLSRHCFIIAFMPVSNLTHQRLNPIDQPLNAHFSPTFVFILLFGSL